MHAQRTRLWSIEEITFLKSTYPDHNITVDTISKNLGRTPRAITLKARTLNLKRGPRRRKVETSFLSVQSLEEIKDGKIRSLIVGSLLGDASIRPLYSNFPSTNMKEEHAKRQLFYVQWKAKILKPLGAKVFIYQRQYQGRLYQTQCYLTSHLPLFYTLRKRLYNSMHKGSKVNFGFLLDLLDPLSLAVWIMDDGTLHPPGKLLDICTNSFSDKDIDYALIQIQKRFGIQGYIHKTKDGKILRFSASETRKLESITKEFILPEFRYKFQGSKQKFVISKEFQFDYAHYLDTYKGACMQCHGHLGVLIVSVKAEKNEETGMVVDFKELNKIVTSKVIKKLDHHLINEVADELASNATAENMCVWIWKQLENVIPNLYELKLFETPTSFVVYRGGN